MDDLQDGREYVCAGKGELFKNIEYGKIDILKMKRNAKTSTYSVQKITPPECVRPKIITIVRNGVKPRKVFIL